MPISAYSKGAKGLSVLLRVRGILTATTISLSISPRQRSTRYTIRAGRNLAAKELRYHRTVCGTGDIGLTTKLLLEAWYHLIPRSRSFEVPTFQLKESRIYLCSQPTCLDCHIHQTARLTFSVTPKIKHLHAGRGILTSCASTTPYGLALATY